MLLLLLLLLPLAFPSVGWPQAPKPPRLEWDYQEPAPPTRFVVRRSLDGGQTWEDVADLPGRTGVDLTWTDTTLPPTPAQPLVADYLVFAVKQTAWSQASNRATVTRGGAPRLLPAAMTVHSVDSPTNPQAANQGRLAIDGDAATWWSTSTGAKPAELPHWIILDLGESHWIDGLAYLPRQDTTVQQGTIAQYHIDVSDDPKKWGKPVAEGTWSWETPLEQYARWERVKGRYVRLKALTEAGGGPWTSAAELGVYALPVLQPPVGSACTVTEITTSAVTITCPLGVQAPPPASGATQRRRP